ncbi:MAG: RNA polymerase sigma factor [Symploca sp. SIO2C1]|nr:RNA polymerase sigma factor [Symploca sp. SIO2C1]
MKNKYQGDATVFWQLWVQHQDYLYQRCLNWMKGNYTDAQEALSRASIKAWEKWQDYAETITNPKAWMTQLTHNLCLDMHREYRREARGIEGIEEIAMAEDNYLAFSSSSSESTVLDRERNSYLYRILNTLPAKVRIPFILWCEEEMSYSDIAKQLALPKEKVRKRVQQGRTLLKKQLQEYFSELDDSSCAGEEQFNYEFIKLAWEKLLSEPITTSGCKTQINTKCTSESIDYKVTTTCLEVLSHQWYSSHSCLGWR